MYYLTDKSDNTKEIQQKVKGFHFLKADICFKKSSAGRGIPSGDTNRDLNSSLSISNSYSRNSHSYYGLTPFNTPRVWHFSDYKKKPFFRMSHWCMKLILHLVSLQNFTGTDPLNYIKSFCNDNGGCAKHVLGVKESSFFSKWGLARGDPPPQPSFG